MGRLKTGLILSLLTLAPGCGEEAPPPPERPIATAAPPADSPAIDEALEALSDGEEEAEPTEKSVDEMSRAELEAACYAGRQAACDLLGH